MVPVDLSPQVQDPSVDEPGARDRSWRQAFDDELPPPGRSRERIVFAAAVVVALVVAGLAFATATDHSEGRTRPGTEQPSNASDRQFRVRGEALPHVAVDLPRGGSFVGPRRYATDLMGIEMTFAIDVELQIDVAMPGNLTFDLGFGLAARQRGRAVRFVRLGGWQTREEAVDFDVHVPASIDPYDVDGWIAQGDVIVDDRAEATVAGRPALVLDVRADPVSDLSAFSCGRDPTSGEMIEPCFWYARASDVAPARIGTRNYLDRTLHPLVVSRMWLVTIDGHDPLLIEAIAPVGDEAWLDEVGETTVATLHLGPDGPPPADSG